MRNNWRPSEDSEIVPLPLVIGVTGHRDLREGDRESLETQVNRIFGDLQSRYPSTPLVLLSPLAEGADRLVARVALERRVRLIAPLPMPREVYEQDFQTSTSREEFNILLQQAERWFELPLYTSNQEEEALTEDRMRDRQYAQVGTYIALHSQILIALWDGKDTHKEGGTSQIVRLQLHGLPENHPGAALRSPLDEPENGPVYHIVTPRIENTAIPEQAFQLRKLFPIMCRPDHRHFKQVNVVEQHGDTHKMQERYLDTAEQEFERILKHLDTFNREAMVHVARLNGKKEQSKRYLFGNLDTSTFSLELKTTLARYADLYATADTLAIYFRKQTVRVLRVLSGLFFISLLCFDVFAHLDGYLRNFFGEMLGGRLSFAFLLFYLFFLFIAYYIWYYRAKRGDYKNKYLDYRALAEGLRVQFFWRAAGLPDTIATHYLRKQKSVLDWIRNSIRVANLLADVGSREGLAGEPAIPPERSYHLIMRPWVHEQSRYFTYAARRDHEMMEKNERRVRGFFLIGMGLALALFILQSIQMLAQPMNWAINILPLLIVLMSLALVLAALLEGFADKMAYSEQTKQYQRMSRLFWHAFQHLNDSLEQGKFQEAERVIREVGEEALAENGDWVLLHRARPLHVPMGG